MRAAPRSLLRGPFLLRAEEAIEVMRGRWSGHGLPNVDRGRWTEHDVVSAAPILFLLCPSTLPLPQVMLAIVLSRMLRRCVLLNVSESDEIRCHGGRGNFHDSNDSTLRDIGGHGNGYWSSCGSP